MSALAVRHGIEQEVRAKTVVAAAGGFEANLAWLREAWGPAADNFLVRGTPYNVGRVLRILLDKGAKSIGDATQGHCVAIDARSPKFDGGICTRVDCVSLGVVVNESAHRFYDEGLRTFYQLSDARSALRLFQLALREDSTFAMAAFFVRFAMTISTVTCASSVFQQS